MLLVERLIARVARCVDTFPDPRRGRNTTYPGMRPFGMAAFSVFFMQSPSFLAHQRQLEQGHGRSNCTGLFGIGKIPSDNHIRTMLDPAPPSLLQPAFDDVLTALEAAPGGLDVCRRLGGHVLIAFDGTEYFCSDAISCPQCSTRRRSNGKTEHFHAMLGATLVAPGHDKVIPLPPEFIAPQDGAGKQDCENAAVKRWLATHGPRYARFDPIYLGDDLNSRQPICQAVLDQRAHFIFVCKPSSHLLIAEYIRGVDLETYEETHKRGKTRFIYRYRWIHNVPLRDGNDALQVNWFDIEIRRADNGKVTYHNSFITDLPIDANNIVELAACGRARWKIENETFNVLKTKGYNLEHNFGHGQQNLAAILVTLNLLAFAIHTACDIAEDLWCAARDTFSSRRQFFAGLAAITTFAIFASWTAFLHALASKKLPPQPPPIPP
jgi:hypothetical protein